MKEVLVTGANGHLGLALVQRLKERGYAVRASVRDSSAPEKTRHLRNLGVTIVQADVLHEQELDAAVAGVDVVFHVAAVHTLAVTDALERVYRPIVAGTTNVLRACKRHGVGKIVLTSSAAAVGTSLPGEPPLDENSWNQQTTDPYLRAKIDAEKFSWTYAAEHRLELVAVLPAAIIGPGFYRHTPTTRLFEDVVRGKVPFVLPMSLSLVDVRDVADAHILAAENPRAAGRYIVSNRFLTLRELLQMLHELDPEIAMPRVTIPKFFLGAFPWLDWLRSSLVAGPRLLNRHVVRDYGYREPRFINTRAVSELGWQPRPIEDSLRDTLSWVRSVFLQDQRATPASRTDTEEMGRK